MDAALKTITRMLLYLSSASVDRGSINQRRRGVVVVAEKKREYSCDRLGRIYKNIHSFTLSHSTGVRYLSVVIACGVALYPLRPV